MGKSEASSAAIPRRPLGKTGVEVTAIAFDGPPGRKQHGFPPLEDLAA